MTTLYTLWCKIRSCIVHAQLSASGKDWQCMQEKSGRSDRSSDVYNWIQFEVLLHIYAHSPTQLGVAKLWPLSLNVWRYPTVSRTVSDYISRSTRPSPSSRACWKTCWVWGSKSRCKRECPLPKLLSLMLLQAIKSHLLSMKLNPVKIKKPDSAPWMCYVNFRCEEDRQVNSQGYVYYKTWWLYCIALDNGSAWCYLYTGSISNCC